jgi:hypothetical protein
MVALQGNAIVRIPIGDAVGASKTVDPQLVAIADVFG